MSVPSPLSASHARPAAPAVLRGVRVLSLALNLPGPAALMRLAAMGAQCLKIEPPGGDPMAHYSASFYRHLHEGIEVQRLDLKQPQARTELQALLARTDVLMTSSRPGALARLGLDGATLREALPELAWVAIVGDYAPLDEVPGHDLTYQAEAGLIDGQLPPTLWADMVGSLLAVEATLQAVLLQRDAALARLRGLPVPESSGLHCQVSLAEAARYAAQPRQHGLTAPGALLGGAHPGYQVLRCRDGWVALAALEPHFLAGWRRCLGLDGADDAALTAAAPAWCLARDAATLNELAQQQDLPLLAWPA